MSATDTTSRERAEFKKWCAEELIPFAYGYRYPDGIRYETGGREINGSKPLEVFKLYDKSALVVIAEAAERLTRERIAAALRELSDANDTVWLRGVADRIERGEL